MNDLEMKAKTVFEKLNADIGVINSRKIDDTIISISQVIGDEEIFVSVESQLNEKSSLTLIFVATDESKSDDEKDLMLSSFYDKFDGELMRKLIADNQDSIKFATRVHQNIFAAYSIDENAFLGNGIIDKTDAVRH